MLNFNALQKGWDLHRKEETLLLLATTIENSVGHWVGLQTAFEWQLQQTATLFEQDRRTALAELQARLQRLVD